MKVIVAVVIFFLSMGALAKERIYLSAGKKYISLGRDLSKGLHDVVLKDFAIRTKGKPVIGDGDDYWVVNSELRAKFLKELGIAETDNLYLKVFDKDKTVVHPISKLSFAVELNFAGDTHVASFGFEYGEDGRAIAMIGKENPFKDVAIKTLSGTKGVYRLDSQHVLALRKDGKEFDMKTGNRDDGFLVGEFTINLQAGEKREEIYKQELETASYVTNIDIFAGDVLKDGSTLLLIKYNDCGDFVKIVKDKTEKWKSPCGDWGC